MKASKNQVQHAKFLVGFVGTGLLKTTQNFMGKNPVMQEERERQ